MEKSRKKIRILWIVLLVLAVGATSILFFSNSARRDPSGLLGASKNGDSALSNTANGANGANGAAGDNGANGANGANNDTGNSGANGDANGNANGNANDANNDAGNSGANGDGAPSETIVGAKPSDNMNNNENNPPADGQTLDKNGSAGAVSDKTDGANGDGVGNNSGDGAGNNSDDADDDGGNAITPVAPVDGTRKPGGPWGIGSSPYGINEPVPVPHKLVPIANESGVPDAHAIFMDLPALFSPVTNDTEPGCPGDGLIDYLLSLDSDIAEESAYEGYRKIIYEAGDVYQEKTLTDGAGGILIDMRFRFPTGQKSRRGEATYDEAAELVRIRAAVEHLLPEQHNALMNDFTTMRHWDETYCRAYGLSERDWSGYIRSRYFGMRYCRLAVTSDSVTISIYPYNYYDPYGDFAAYGTYREFYTYPFF